MFPRVLDILRIFSVVSPLLTTAFAAERPNIIWLVGEDLGPELGCYGDNYARTPNLDKLAAEGARFTRAFTHAPVCAPSRSGLITGRYPTAVGTHHMRSKLINPPPLFTDYLRKARSEERRVGEACRCRRWGRRWRR